MDALLPCILTNGLLSVIGVCIGQRTVNVSSDELNWLSCDISEFASYTLHQHVTVSGSITDHKAITHMYTSQPC